ncbi:6,7-dimethyl-8-ribityllumazine synthase [Altererythrobacter sp. B11]|uniref:6,7-dimethyl-8-ribityllumazine synthase n=1 Tax=Altererythrobacter sp. B11 TaxID=2060312 RepID=UPI000DC715EF|nr:6,7-dimethyl-8-ribityllumazine synthase [Altererythrobacter sp. B11]BBC71977.1 6,7-dimethyl-8-ribityllumazine synthase [Altererythrobacter sp. B11]
MPDPIQPRIALVVSQFNPEVTDGLRDGALAALAERGVKVADADIHSAPGAFEIPLLARALAHSGYDGVVGLGCVIKGDTAHFEYISQAASIGLMQAGLETGKPLTFGIITVYTEEQAVERSRADAHNKGREAAEACYAALQTLAAIRARGK